MDSWTRSKKSLQVGILDVFPPKYSIWEFEQVYYNKRWLKSLISDLEKVAMNNFGTRNNIQQIGSEINSPAYLVKWVGNLSLFATVQIPLQYFCYVNHIP